MNYIVWTDFGSLHWTDLTPGLRWTDLNAGGVDTLPPINRTMFVLSGKGRTHRVGDGKGRVVIVRPADRISLAI